VVLHGKSRLFVISKVVKVTFYGHAGRHKLGAEIMNHYAIMANCSEEQACAVASLVMQHYAQGQVKLISGPRQGLVMMRVRETVANGLFNAGEVLVTEVKLELDGQFGFGMVLGDSPRRALAVALVDAALRKEDGDYHTRLVQHLTDIEQQLIDARQRMQALIATTKVEFDRMEA